VAKDLVSLPTAREPTLTRFAGVDQSVWQTKSLKILRPDWRSFWWTISVEGWI
jgi:hypothetical protein